MIEGTVTFRLDGRELTVGPGEAICVPAGMSHQFWNAGDDEVALRLRGAPGAAVRAADRDDVLARADGKTNRKGMPNPLRLAVIAHAHFDTVRLPFPPVWMQRVGLALGAPVGRLLGYGATYEPASEPLTGEVAAA